MTISTAYGQAYKSLGLGRFDFTAGTFKMALTGPGYSPDVDADEFFDDITGEIVGAGYTAGGLTLTGLAWTYDAVSRRCVLTCDPANWTPLTAAAVRFAVAYRDTGDPATSPLLSYVYFEADKAPAGSPFIVTFADGLFRLLTPLTG